MSLSLQLLTSLSYLANYNIDLGYVCHSNWVHLSWTKVIAKEKIPALFGIVFVIVIVSDTQTVKPSLYTDDERFFVVHILASWLTWLNIVGDEGHTMLQFLSIKQLPHILELLCSHSSFGHRRTANVFPAYWSTVPESHALYNWSEKEPGEFASQWPISSSLRTPIKSWLRYAVNILSGKSTTIVSNRQQIDPELLGA